MKKVSRILLFLTTWFIVFLLTAMMIQNVFASNKLENIEGEISPVVDGNIETPTVSNNTSLSPYKNYMEAYFSGLTKNMGENSKNSCGYVAIGQILSYYDSFLSDNIIAEQYDQASKGTDTNIVERKDSPGIKNDKIRNVGSMTIQEYWDRIESMQGEYFRAKLMVIGKSLGILNLDDGDYLGVTTNSQRVKILKTYLSDRNITNYTIVSASDVYSSGQLTSNNVKAFVKENIDAGYPVLLGARASVSDRGHAMVCYKYDDSEFYGNKGYTSDANNAYFAITKEYPIFTNAMVLKFNTNTHYHSYNYEVKVDGETYEYCYCNSNIYTYSTEMKKFDQPDFFDGNFVVPNWMTRINGLVFANNSNITSLDFEPNGKLQSIDRYAFVGCSNLTNINLPNTVINISNTAFNGCANLSEITIESGNTVYMSQGNCIIRINDNTLIVGCKTSVIPSTVTSIGSYAFYGTGLTSISIPSSVESIGEEAFGGNYLTEINVQLGNSNYYSEEGVLFGNGGVLIVYPIGKEGVYVVPDGTTEIGNYAFCGCYQLKGIVIPSSVTKINDYAFVGCDQLEEFIFAEGSTLEYIGYEAFAGCWALEEITIPSSVTYVGALAFATWEEHQKIVVQADVSVLEQWDVDWAVDCYAEIEWDGYNLVATEGLGYILTDNGYEVEVGSSLEHSNGVVIIPAEYEGYPVIGVADNGFAGRSELIKVIFAGNNLIRIGTNAFGDCHNLIAINIPDGVTEIGDNAFYACHQLQNVRLPRTVERIGDSVFAECHNLKSVTVPGGVVYVEASALEGTVGYTIYTEMGSNPSEWYFLNNNPECAIFYNCMLSEDGTYVVFIVIQEENYINADPSAPYRDGYVLLGWTTVYGGDVEYTMQEVSDGAIDYGTVLYAVWQREV